MIVYGTDRETDNHRPWKFAVNLKTIMIRDGAPIQVLGHEVMCSEAYLYL
jgi:hypothetical protein